MRRFAALPVSILLAVLLVAPSASAGTFAGPLSRDFMRQEVLRMINGERAQRGLARVKLDTFLAAKAHDSTVRCPNDAGKLNKGRAQALAAQAIIPAPHQLELCTSYTVLSVLPYWNYSGTRAEILAPNNQDFSRVRYDYGCPSGAQLTCGRSSYTYAPNTAARAVRMWMNSSGHRSIVLGSYSRVGCGVWQGGTAYYGGYAFPETRWYACVFANAGPSSYVDATGPTVSSVAVNGSPYVPGMIIGSRVTVTFRLTDSGGPSPRVSDWWAYLDGDTSREGVGYREGAFDAAGSSADTTFSLDVSSLSAGTHRVTIVGRGMDTRKATTTLELRLVK